MPRGEALGREQAEGVLPLRPIATQPQLDSGGAEGGDDHHHHGEGRGAALTADEQPDGRQQRQDRHPDRVEAQLDDAQRAHQAAVVVGPVLAGPSPLVDLVEGRAVAGHRPGECGEGEQAQHGPEEGDSARGVQHAVKYASRIA